MTPLLAAAELASIRKEVSATNDGSLTRGSQPPMREMCSTNSLAALTLCGFEVGFFDSRSWRPFLSPYVRCSRRSSDAATYSEPRNDNSSSLTWLVPDSVPLEPFIRAAFFQYWRSCAARFPAAGVNTRSYTAWFTNGCTTKLFILVFF